jgi:hypothetical protein
MRSRHRTSEGSSDHQWAALLEDRGHHYGPLILKVIREVRTPNLLRHTRKKEGVSNLLLAPFLISLPYTNSTPNYALLYDLLPSKLHSDDVLRMELQNAVVSPS